MAINKLLMYTLFQLYLCEDQSLTNSLSSHETINYLCSCCWTCWFQILLLSHWLFSPSPLNLHIKLATHILLCGQFFFKFQPIDFVWFIKVSWLVIENTTRPLFDHFSSILDEKCVYNMQIRDAINRNTYVFQIS